MHPISLNSLVAYVSIHRNGVLFNTFFSFYFLIWSIWRCGGLRGPLHHRRGGCGCGGPETFAGDSRESDRKCRGSEGSAGAIGGPGGGSNSKAFVCDRGTKGAAPRNNRGFGPQK